jgi:hypothetical protein
MILLILGSLRIRKDEQIYMRRDIGIRQKSSGNLIKDQYKEA